jgi:hypothetical protein
VRLTVRAVPLVGALLIGCASTPSRRVEVGAPGSVRCGVDGFTKSRSEHIVVELAQPVRVRSVEGVITSQAGEWPDDIAVTLELRPRAGGRSIHVQADGRGSFKVPDVPPGEYCFKASADGWRSIIGVIVVAREADSAARIRLQMLLGV